jgi:hypothetical protein
MNGHSVNISGRTPSSFWIGQFRGRLLMSLPKPTIRRLHFPGKPELSLLRLSVLRLAFWRLRLTPFADGSA